MIFQCVETHIFWRGLALVSDPFFSDCSCLASLKILMRYMIQYHDDRSIYILVGLCVELAYIYHSRIQRSKLLAHCDEQTRNPRGAIVTVQMQLDHRSIAPSLTSNSWLQSCQHLVVLLKKDIFMVILYRFIYMIWILSWNRLNGLRKYGAANILRITYILSFFFAFSFCVFIYIILKVDENSTKWS